MKTIIIFSIILFAFRSFAQVPDNNIKVLAPDSPDSVQVLLTDSAGVYKGRGNFRTIPYLANLLRPHLGGGVTAGNKGDITVLGSGYWDINANAIGATEIAGGAINLTFSGTTAPITLINSEGSDVKFDVDPNGMVFLDQVVANQLLIDARVISDLTLHGDGGGPNALGVDTSIIATKHDLLGLGGGGGASSWNAITNPTGNQALTFDDGETSTWTINSDVENALSINSSSLTSGALINLAITGTSALNNQKGINVLLSGANSTIDQSTYGIYSSNTHPHLATGVYGDGTLYGIWGNTVAGNAINGVCGSGRGISIQAGQGLPGYFRVTPFQTNSVRDVMRLVRTTSGAAANGIGGSLSYYLQSTTGAEQVASQIITEFTDATDLTRTSAIRLLTVNSGALATRLTIAGSGALKFNNYGLGTFTGTPAYSLQVDASGNVIEGSLSGGGGGYANVALDNLTSVAINAPLTLGTSDAFALGSATKQWSDLYLAPGAVIDWNNADLTFANIGNGLVLLGGVQNSPLLSIGQTSAPTTQAAFNVQAISANTAHFTNTATTSPATGAGIVAYSDDGATMESGHRLGFYFFGGASNTTHSLRNSAGIASFTTENWIDASAYGSELKFEVTPNGSTTRAAKVKIESTGNLTPNISDNVALGTTALQWSDLFLAEGGVINWDNGDATLTQTENVVTLSGAQLKLGAYGLGTITGTPAYDIQVDATGNVIEVPVTGTTLAYSEKSITSNTTWEPLVSSIINFYDITAQAANVTIGNPVGSAVNHSSLLIRATCDSTHRTLTWSGSQWRASTTVPLPINLTANKTMYIQFIYDSTAMKWDLVSVSEY